MYYTKEKVRYVEEPILKVHTLADSGFFKNFLYQGGVKSTVSWVFEDLKFKISEGYDQNWCFPDSAQLAVSVYFGRIILADKSKVLDMHWCMM